MRHCGWPAETGGVAIIVDVHAHYYPVEYLEQIRRPDLPPSGAARLRSQPMVERLELLDRVGVDTQILSVSQAQPYLPDPREASSAARYANEVFSELCEEHPGRFFTFAALPLPHIEESLAEIARVGGEPKVVGFTLGCSIAGLPLDDPRFGPVFDALDEIGAVVFLHPVGDDCLVHGEDHNFNWGVGAPFEDTLAALRLVLSGVADRCARVRFIVPHLGGTLPFLLSRVSRLYRGRSLDALYRMYFDTVSGSVEALSCTCAALGPDRLLFGTDYPYCDEATFATHLEYLSGAGIDPAQLAQIRGDRAAELLGLVPSGRAAVAGQRP